ncbi:hypothetical protein [Pelagibius marinus]|uniref:hypothetical protein n=1 Tax=Pelagibius marinus TaxID=2762760 RepID=UPI0018725DBE|nr:hypothetical protein [Pelagibius marinus]
MFGGSKEKRFWNWFQKNEDRLFDVVTAGETICNDLQRRMAKVDPYLTFLFGPVRDDGKREFIISADGIKRSFPAVEALHDAAPELPRWVWIKYRPRLGMSDHMVLEGREYSSNDVTYKMYEDDGKVGLEIFMKGLTEEDRKFHQEIGMLFLDHALGEYDVETRVGFIEFISAADERADDASPLADLAENFDRYFEQRNKGLH